MTGYAVFQKRDLGFYTCVAGGDCAASLYGGHKTPQLCQSFCEPSSLHSFNTTLHFRFWQDRSVFRIDPVQLARYLVLTHPDIPEHIQSILDGHCLLLH